MLMKIKIQVTYRQGHFYSFPNILTTEIRKIMETMSLLSKFGQLLLVGCEVEQASPRRAMYGALKFPGCQDSHTWPAQGKEAHVRSLYH